MIPSEAPNDPCLPSFLELTQALGRLVADVENAKRFSNEQLAFFEQQINDLKSVCDGLAKERDDAIDQLKAICKEKDELGIQLDELRGAKQESDDARRETESALLQLARVQKELEHYFLLSSQQFKLLDEYRNLEARAAVLLSIN